MRILVTGAAGAMGRMLEPLLRNEDRDIVRTDLIAGEGVLALDVTDPGAVRAACEGVDAIVHLAGISSEDSFAAVTAVNVVGTQNVLAAAVGAGVGRVILASSNHAVGFYRRSDLPPGTTMLADPLAVRPDTYYGWSKAAMEALGALHHQRFGIDVVALRIGTCVEEPRDTRALATWLAPIDAAGLIGACLTAPDVGFRAIWAVSDNARRWWSIEGSQALGYRPVENAERFAHRLISVYGDPDVSAPIHDCVGGHFCAAPLGERMG